MRLNNLISFNSNVKSSSEIKPPVQYQKEFPYIIFLTNTLFIAFDYCSTRVKLPSIEDFMQVANIKDTDFLVFGESDAWGWSDIGCKFLYAIALKRPFTMDISTVKDLMWMKWLRDNISRCLCLTNRYSHICLGSIEYANSESEAKISGYFGKPIYPCCVIESFRENGVMLYKCYRYGEYRVLDKQQLTDWIRTGEVLNASIGKKPLKNGSYRLNIKYLTD